MRNSVYIWRMWYNYDLMVHNVFTKPQRVGLLGIGTDPVTMEQAIQLIQYYIEEGQPHHIVTCDASMVVMAQADPVLGEIVRSAALVTPDSVGILWACKKLATAMPERVSGIDIVQRLIALSSQPDGPRIFFLGAAPGVADDAAARMREIYPGAQIVGSAHGYFKEADEADVIETIKAAKPDVLCVALGIPKQEKWIYKYAKQLGVPVLIGVGGSFDVLSGRVKRAPKLFQTLSIEWVWRLVSNPSKIAKVSLLPKFAWMVLTAKQPKGD